MKYNDKTREEIKAAEAEKQRRERQKKQNLASKQREKEKTTRQSGIALPDTDNVDDLCKAALPQLTRHAIQLAVKSNDIRQVMATLKQCDLLVKLADKNDSD